MRHFVVIVFLLLLVLGCSQIEQSPEGYQPEVKITFNHKIHAGTLGLSCGHCHSSQTTNKPILPDKQICLNCHESVKDSFSIE